MNKKIIYIAIGVVTLLFLFLAFLLIKGSSKKEQTASTPTRSASTASRISTEATPGQQYTNQPTSAPGQALAPEQVVGNFYKWYIAHPGVSALTSGEYKSSPYLSKDFKELIAGFAPYSSDHDPLFCPKNRTEDFAVRAAENGPKNRVNVIIQDAKQGRPLYQVVLQNIDQQWLIVDTACIY